jgi:hypothetical protein
MVSALASFTQIGAGTAWNLAIDSGRIGKFFHHPERLFECTAFSSLVFYDNKRLLSKICNFV